MQKSEFKIKELGLMKLDDDEVYLLGIIYNLNSKPKS